MANSFDNQSLVTVARLYHLSGLKQEQIASRLMISRAMVSLMLTEARRLGIVEVRVCDPQSEYVEYAEVIHSHFSLERCVVIPTSAKAPEILRELVASRAVAIFNEQLSDGDTIAMAWGRTCHAFMEMFQPDRRLRATKVVPLVGMSNMNLSSYQLNETVRKFAATIDAKPYFVHAPALTRSIEDCHLYMQSTNMKDIMESWANVDIAVVAIGAPPISEEFDGSDIAHTRQKNRQNLRDHLSLPVGNMSARYFNIDGKFLDDEISRRTIAISPDALQRVPKVIALAAGSDRACSIIGALNTGAVKTLVIDESAAEAVVGVLQHKDERTGYQDLVLSLYNGSATS